MSYVLATDLLRCAVPVKVQCTTQYAHHGVYMLYNTQCKLLKVLYIYSTDSKAIIL